MQDSQMGIHCFVSGKVQGVWYRASTREVANQLGLTGWARNCADGRVEVMAFGERAKVMQLYDWLQEGPRRAKVLAVSLEEIAWQEIAGFKVE